MDGRPEVNSTIDRINEIEQEIAEYMMMIDHAIQTNNKDYLKMWRIALQTAKIAKRRLANS